MASISVPCPKCSLARPGVLSRSLGIIPPRSIVPCQMDKERICTSLSAVPEAFIQSTNSTPKPPRELDAVFQDVDQTDDTSSATADSKINAFMAEVLNLVKLVDSRDIVELQLKQMDCEIIIRKKEALTQPPVPPPVVMMQGPPQAVYAPPPPSPAPHSLDVASKSVTPPALSLPQETSSSLPPLKCPMSGTFYRRPGPGEPPFVEVGDKVQKGQVVCIIEAMKLMNEIEADQSGTIVEIIAEDGKPVGVDSPLLIIQP